MEGSAGATLAHHAPPHEAAACVDSPDASNTGARPQLATAPPAARPVGPPELHPCLPGRRKATAGGSPDTPLRQAGVAPSGVACSTAGPDCGVAATLRAEVPHRRGSGHVLCPTASTASSSAHCPEVRGVLGAKTLHPAPDGGRSWNRDGTVAAAPAAGTAGSAACRRGAPGASVPAQGTLRKRRLTRAEQLLDVKRGLQACARDLCAAREQQTVAQNPAYVPLEADYATLELFCSPPLQQALYAASLHRAPRDCFSEHSRTCQLDTRVHAPHSAAAQAPLRRQAAAEGGATWPGDRSPPFGDAAHATPAGPGAALPGAATPHFSRSSVPAHQEAGSCSDADDVQACLTAPSAARDFRPLLPELDSNLNPAPRSVRNEWAAMGQPMAVGEGTESTGRGVRIAPHAEQAEKACRQVPQDSAVPPTIWSRLDTFCTSISPPPKPYEELKANVSPKSLRLFGIDTTFRRLCLTTVKSRWFEILSLTLILVNCVFLAMDSNAPDFSHTNVGALLRGAELFFVIAFTLEAVFKVIALGLIRGEGSYLRDSWNVIDCVVVIVGWLAFLPGIDNFSVMRTVRVLRPLRTITGVQGMRLLVVTLLKSMPMLLDVLILCTFGLFIFGTIGLQTFSSALRYTCGAPVPGTLTPGGLLKNVTQFSYDSRVTCGDNKIPFPNEDSWFSPSGTTDLPLTQGTGYECPSGPSHAFGTYCYDGGKHANPNHGITSFDNILWAWLTIFQCISLEGWTDIMYAVQDGVNDWVWIYFVVLIVLGSFFAVNLALAVLYLQFTESTQVVEATAKQERRKQQQAAARAPPPPPPPVSHSQRCCWLDPCLGPAWHKLSTLCFRVQAHPLFNGLTMFLIVFNTLVMASEHHGMAEWHRSVNEIVNVVLTAYFAFDMLVKVIGLGVMGYLEDRMNAFDGVIVFASLAELGISALSSRESGSLSVLRTFRLLRVFKLARSWHELNKIVRTIFKSLASIAYLSLILLLFIFIMALLGMQLFGYKFIFCDVEGATPSCPLGLGSMYACPDGSDTCYSCPQHYDCFLTCDAASWGQWIASPGSPFNDLAFCERFPRVDSSFSDPAALPLEVRERYWGSGEPVWEYAAHAGKSVTSRRNFDNIFWSVITIFDILTGENWNEVMYDGIRTTNTGAAIYFLFIVVIGNYVILNLFLAILLDNFAGGNDDDDEADWAQTNLDKISADLAAHTVEPTECTEAHKRAWFFGGLHAGVSVLLEGVFARKKKKKQNAIANENRFDAPSSIPSTVHTQAADDLESVFHDEVAEACLHGRSLFVFGPDSPLRCFFAAIIRHRFFETAIIFLICVSSLTLALDSPGLDPTSTFAKVLNILDVFFVCAFTVEAVLKVTVMGLVFQRDAYLHSPWNVLDGLIVIVGIVLLVSSGENTELTALRSLRTLRALRPLRMASRAPGMKVVVNALFQSIPAIGNVLLVCILFYLIFGILAINLMSGMFYKCVDSNGATLDPDYYVPVAAQPMTDSWCQQGTHVITGVTDYYHASIPAAALPPGNALADGNTWTLEHAWTNPPANFDNIFTALLSLFEIATLELWLDFMNSGVDGAGAGNQPIRDHTPAKALFFVAFIVVGSFFVLNLFVGVAIDKFNEMQAEHQGNNIFLTPEQEQWVTVQRLFSKCNPKRRHVLPSNPIRAFVFKIAMSDWFNGVIMAIILINVCCLTITWAGMPDSLSDVLSWLNIAFTAIFTLEAAMKITALGVKPYLQDTWCRFDFIVVLFSIVQIVAETMSGSDIPAVSFLRVFRVARIFRLVPKAKGLRTLFQTLVYSLPALVNVGSVFFLFMFIFAIMGMNLFGTVRHAEFLNRHANFGSFSRSLLVLMRMATGESWNGIMHDCMVQTDCIALSDPFTDSEGQLWPSTGDSGVWFDQNDPRLVGAPRGALINQCAPAPIFAVLYFMLFVVLCAFLLLNLVIAVILDNFQSSTNNEQLEVSATHLRNFLDVWSELDPNCTHYIPTQKLTHLIGDLLPPLGTAGKVHAHGEVQDIIMSIDIPNRSFDGVPAVHFTETIHALAGRVAGTQLPTDEEEKVHGRFAGKLPPGTEYPKYTAGHYHAALHVQAAVRGFLVRHNMREQLTEVTRRIGSQPLTFSGGVVPNPGSARSDAGGSGAVGGGAGTATGVRSPGLQLGQEGLPGTGADSGASGKDSL